MPFIFAALAFVASPAVSAHGAESVQPLIGRASVIDGDTIEIAGERVRINGIDAPESSQLCQDQHQRSYRCGAIAAGALDKLLAQSRPLRCEFVERDQYGRVVGDCFRADGVNVAAALVRAGMALDWPRYSSGAYANEQSVAAAAKAGLWQGEFQPPWEWRAEQRNSSIVAPLIAPVTSDGCGIKGNISRSGEQIYHIPGMRDYDQTQINERAGERWFCSEAEAQDAGWRRAQR
ncbi:endonuclease YncB(thermonuclease family) [Devosia subaequoris]|uniref:Endonuclease YncB(Thermonuclease family) n=1 Tax=Devosia subaequoris TaxID=395930 RepID=A0A7W6ND12_9HYPH|nr:thermonuclease family protein [Devosia subaequoris]MBB4053533.1 endonuclease YncB(thermonuclease family) [Devosia subaequoris]